MSRLPREKNNRPPNEIVNYTGNSGYGLALMVLICFAFLAAIPMFVDGGHQPEPIPGAYQDCPERVAIPVIGIKSFAFCPADSTVWTGKAWAEPTAAEWRRIYKFYGEE